jgi:protein-disulfide isomerase
MENNLNADPELKQAAADQAWHLRGKRTVFYCLAAIAMLWAATALHAAPQTSPAHPVVHKAPATKAATSMQAPVKVYGTKGAPITMEVFTDYECPICRVFFEQTLRFVINDYVASGKVYIIHHDFPLVMHPYSGQAARWANAAATVGEFGSAEAALYDNQAAWTADGNMAKFIAESMPSSDFQRVAAIMRQCTTPAPQDQGPGIDPMAKSGNSCPVDPYIAQDIALGNKDAVNATPTYIITYKGQRLPAGSSAVSWPILKQFFDSLLSQ